MKHMIGCNYWGSKAGIDMWVNWDAESIRKDLEHLYEYGCRVLRIFPTWRDFQPLHPMRAGNGFIKEVYLHGKERMKDEFGLDESCVEHMHEFCKMCEEIGLELIVSIVTGWMSGRQYLPPIVENLNLITDPKALRWQERFVKGIVKSFKDEKSIVAWDLGNECNNLAGGPRNSDDAFLWSILIANTIKSQDQTRPIMSGMHGLTPCIESGHWLIQDQAEATDILTTHPYYSPTIKATDSYPDEMRASVIPTVQTQFYADIGEKPAMMQEHGTFTEINMNHELGATDVKQHILSGFFNGSKGLLFWCGMDFADISMPPYEWIGMETRLGLLKTDYTPKPVAFSIKECQKIIEDIGELPDKEYEVACYVGEGQDFGHNFLDYSVPAFVLTKQSGLDIKFYSRTNREIPDAKVYLYPGIVAWSGTGYVSWQERIMEKVREGAIFYISFDGGFLHDFEALTGLVSHGHSFRSYVKSCVLDGEKFSFSNVKEMRLENRDAEVICETEDHNVLFARKRHGKGYVYFNAMGIEKSLYNHDYNAFTLEDKANYYKFYDIFMKDIAKDKPILCRNKNVLVTHHKIDENEYIVSAINYSGKEQNPNFRVKDGMTYEMLYGKFDSIPANGTVILKVKKI